MKQATPTKRKVKMTIAVAFFGIIVLCLSIFFGGMAWKGYTPTGISLAMRGFTPQGNNCYVEKETNTILQLAPEGGTYARGGFVFTTPLLQKSLLGVSFIHRTTLNLVTCQTTNHNFFDEAFFTDIAPLFAHALGGVYFEENGFDYSNSLEALLYNYSQGFRLFEVDLGTTSDGVVACLHDWGRFDSSEPRNSAYFNNFPIMGHFTSLTINELFDFMIACPDTYIITDSKTFSSDDCAALFNKLCAAAKEKDPAILQRVVPQIYNMEMYDVLLDIYPFENMIFTLYATDASNEEVVAFVESKDNISIVTMWDERATEEFCTALNAVGKLVFTHTINDTAEMAASRSRGVYGFYTDWVTPGVYENEVVSMPSQTED